MVKIFVNRINNKSVKKVFRIKSRNNNFKLTSNNSKNNKSNRKSNKSNNN